MSARRSAARRGSAARGRSALLVAIALLLFPVPISAQSRTVRGALAHVDPERIRAHIEFLSSDLLEGRGIGTRGGALAAEYIAGQFLQTGLRPLRGTWFHTVPLSGWRADTSRTRITVGAPDANVVRLGAGEGALLWPGAARADAVASGELVFVGYGTRAPEYGWDDYKRDVRGRIVIVLAGDPPAPPGSADLFDGDALTYYGRWTYKLEEAARQGAAAVLLVHTPELAGYDWQVVRGGWGGEVVSLREDSSRVLPALAGWLRSDAATRLLEAAALDFPQLFVRAARRDFEPVFTGVEIRMEAAGQLRALASPNVAALLPGQHPQRRSEVVVYTAHHDALGIGAPVDGDSIYNGAYDNAAGVALLLELAETFAALPEPPDRSILFLATAAEEAGLLGARHYTRHPLVPLERTVAAINLEGANLWGETDDVSGIGIERSTLGPLLQRAAADAGLRATPERAPAQGFFFRSDQFPFARAGVPAILLDHGISYRRRPPDWGAGKLAAFLARSYHTPFDVMPEPGDLRGAVQQVRVAFLLGHDLATRADRPRYYDDLPPLPPPPAIRSEPAATLPPDDQGS